MGMFDNIHYNGHEYQTKDTPAQSLDNYKIEVDPEFGPTFLWYEDYDAEYVKSEDHFLGGYIEKLNVRWVRCDDFDGNIRFYRTEDEAKTWIEYSALFMDGQLLRIKNISKKNNE
jgi:hypothetical protein